MMRCEEMWGGGGGVRKCDKVWGGMGRRCEEMWGDVRRCGEV